MNIKHISAAWVAGLLALTSCNNFLDEMPDNRTELNTPEKITKILVTAYPEASWNMLAEFSSDNIDDNGPSYSEYDRLTEEVYHWKDSRETGNDSPGNLWEYCYKAAATANLALEAIDRMGNPGSLSAQRGEALMCRAYAHFVLAYIFCHAWNEHNQDTAPGIPYATKPETSVSPSYQRGTLRETYRHIQDDIEEALPLIDDNLYTVPKYHFNVKAANAFAARFYLYTCQYDKAIACANTVLGNNPSALLRNWQALGSLSLNDDVQPNAYVDAASPGNLMLKTAYSFWGLYNGPLTVTARYTHNSVIAKNETMQADGPWGNSDVMHLKPADYTVIPKVIYRKFPLFYFEVVDPSAYTGYYRIVESVFTTDETLLVRAEAYAMKKDYTRALADMQCWQDNFTSSGVQLTEELINDFYGKMDYYTPGKPTAKKELHPDFTVEPGTQENMIHFILHARRILTMHEGLRWGDIKRYGITIYRRLVVRRDITVTDEMTAADPRRALQLPSLVISAGLQANPR